MPFELLRVRTENIVFDKDRSVTGDDLDEVRNFAANELRELRDF